MQHAVRTCSCAHVRWKELRDEHPETNTQRKLIAWITLSMDGYASGPDNDMSRVAAYAGHEQMMAYTEGIWRGVSTTVMGRTNYRQEITPVQPW